MEHPDELGAGLGVARLDLGVVADLREADAGGGALVGLVGADKSPDLDEPVVLVGLGKWWFHRSQHIRHARR
ncbi:hypothetical protein QRX50_08280 [Amycolatopsis carbonis]|uniref:Uncharacterized protein n=1 Tax=Amycolatopsis carbonis TaxID=715471 RepID=A0A9Y2N2S8_9PSEU|nr:hypothetical protein [Amycolatopsis sp. 2-15]WIX84264.1 hypothetical protein QRX50_08280 [Amycolatopsis sp. 2-15]